MRKNTLLTLLILVTLPCVAQDKLLTPAAFLGYEPGERFTSHHQAVAYFRHVAAAVPNATLADYGETYEHRPLIYMAISSEENIRRLEEIRLDNLRRAGVESGTPSGDKVAIVWLSYNVHGNEASSMEAAMLTLHELVNPSNVRVQEWLKNTVVIMDPCLNPDGRDRYSNFYRQYGNNPPNSSYDALEHRESWPGGRYNHYLFDLNRDWAWCTQAESRQRIAVYNKWLPHIHVDFHEQSYNSPYFFAPAAEPLHEVVSPWQRAFQTTIGNNNAKYFDEKGWLYFTKEVFDLYYPSYGDTYPTYSGAIGMTYEQAGGGTGGLAITTETGQTLTLRDRVDHHYTSGLSTIEVSSKNASQIVDEFEKYYRENNTNPSAEYKTYVVKATNNPDKINQLTTWLALHGIRVGHPAATTRPTHGYSYQTQTTVPVTLAGDDIVFNVYQPKSRFITTIFEPTSRLSDTLTYDITAWNLMYAYNLDAFALKERVDAARPFQPRVPSRSVAEKPYAYIFAYNSVQDVSFLASLLKSDIKVRCAARPFSVDGRTFPAGSVVIPRVNNDHVANDFDQLILDQATTYHRSVFSANSGLVEKGTDLGSSLLKYLHKPAVAVLIGRQVSPLSSGEVWHFFEEQIRYPLTQISTEYFDPAVLKSYDVFIIPEGYYRLFDEATLADLSTWIKNGGRLILIGNALEAFTDKKLFSLKRFANGTEKKQGVKDTTALLARYGDAERAQLSDNISGAIYKVALDNSHPLGYGLKNHYYTLKTHERRYAWLANGWNVSYFSDSAYPVQGFAGHRANQSLRQSLQFGVEEVGRGKVIYFVDNPLFRSFWEDGKILFSNAVFLAGD